MKQVKEKQVEIVEDNESRCIGKSQDEEEKKRSKLWWCHNYSKGKVEVKIVYCEMNRKSRSNLQKWAK